MTERLAQLLDDAYVADIESLSIEEIRERRTRCQEEEVTLSYVRRMAQGRLDILVADLRRRAVGDGRAELSELVDQLSEILSEGRRPEGPGRMPSMLAPVIDDELTAEIDNVLPNGTVGDLPDLSDAEALAAGEALRDLERRLSAERRALHDRIELFDRDLVRRYKANEVNVDSILK